MNRKFFRPTSLVAAVFMLSFGAAAENCGEPPVKLPVLPAAERADSDQILATRKAVLDYSKVVDSYIACVEESTSELLPFMSKEQRNRLSNDLTDLHNQRRDLQIAFNELIRSVRRKENN